MAKYFYRNQNNEKVYIKSIDTANGKLTFTKNAAQAYQGRDGYYAEPLRDSLVFGFSEEYPEIKNVQIDYSY